MPEAVGSGRPLNGSIDKLDGMLQLAGEGSLGSQKLPTLSVDEFCFTRQIQPTLMKVDVEGFEWEVLQGASHVLKKSHPRLWLELHPEYLRKSGQTWESVTDFLKTLGYHIYFYEDFKSSNREISFHVWCE